MSEPRALVEHLLWQFHQAWEGSRWHSLRAVLDGLTEEEAAWTPPAYAGFSWMRGSIREILFHLGGDYLFQINRVLGDASWAWERIEARYAGRGGNLAAARQLCHEGCAAVRAALEGFTDPELARRRQGADGRRCRPVELFEMLLEHTLYHTGQIQYVRCMVAGLATAERGGRETENE
ncbi:MAG: DinB family protein [Armatimonadetes bacterium]|nr:DinB family protein [Armatimonadota bacterium]